MDIYLVAKIIGALGTILGSLAGLWKYVINPSVTWFKATNKLWNDIALEFKPNGGGSMKDSLNRIETRQLIKDQKDRALSNDALFGIWESDPEGRCTYVNRTYQRITGYGFESLEGFGWVNIILDKDRDRVLQEWESALKQQREFYSEFRIETPDGKVTPVISVGHPLKARDGVLKGYVGQLVVKGDSDDVFFSYAS